MTATGTDTGLRRLGPAAVLILEGLYQHRLLTTTQIRPLFLPDASSRYTRSVLARLHDAGLAGRARLPGGLAVWYLTPRGTITVEATPNRVETRRKQITPEQAAGPLQAHTLGVNEIGLAFVQAARSRGDESGPFGWRHEIAHNLGPPPGRKKPEQLISDAILTYQHATPDGTTVHYRFIELDRANRSAIDLAGRLARYARLYHLRIPVEDRKGRTVLLWDELYGTFPRLLVALAGRSMAALERRRETELSILAEEPKLQTTPQVQITVCLLEDLTRQGPFAAIFTRPHLPGEPCDWLGQPAANDD